MHVIKHALTLIRVMRDFQSTFACHAEILV